MQNDTVNLSELTNKRALNNYQRNFPLISRPFAQIGQELGLNESETLKLFENLKNKISRIGPVFKPNTIGASTLAAMQVPQERLTEVANYVSSLPEVNHNYEREHVINLWFVVTAPNTDRLMQILKQIEAHTYIPVHDLRLEEEFRIDLGFDLEEQSSFQIKEPSFPLALGSEVTNGLNSKNNFVPVSEVDSTNKSNLINNSGSDKVCSEFINQLIPKIEKGLPLTETPYQSIAEQLNTSEEQVLQTLQFLLSQGQIRRFGVVVKHRELGYNSNAMVVWNIPDDVVTHLGHKIVSHPDLRFVSLCYKRKKSIPDWPYNFYFMIHGKSRDSVTTNLNFLIDQMQMQNFKHRILFSTQCFKQKGARYSDFQKTQSEKLLLNLLQEGLPVTDEPYAPIAAQTGFTSQEILTYIEQWLKDGTLSRFGPMYNVEKFGGEFTLVAMQVPPERFNEVNEVVNSFAEVAHNYEREHALNMWFVVATSAASETEKILKQIEEQTGIKTYALPKLEEYYLNLRFRA